MPTFAYQARDSSGQRVNGTREAADQRAALEALRAAGLFVTQLTPVRGSRSPRAVPPAPSAATPALPVEAAPRAPMNGAVNGVMPAEAASRQEPPVERADPRRPGVAEAPGAPDEARRTVPRLDAQPPSGVKPLLRANAKEMVLFFRQMHAMLHAGTVLSHALNALAENAANPALRTACREMSPRTASGTPWSETMRAYPALFSELAIGMISAGENGGFLDRMCLRLAEYAERDYEIQQTIKRETWYPKILVVMSFLIPSIVPLVLAAVGVTGENPLWAWLKSIGPPFLVMGGIWWAWKFLDLSSPVLARSGSPRYLLDRIKLTVPVAGKTVRALATAKFCRALGALQAAGTGLHATITLAADACGNAVIAESARGIIPRIERGEGLTDSLAATGQFPGIALQMLRTGEESGSIEQQLDKVADFLEQDAETTIKQSVKLLGVIVFLLVAIKIGIQVVQFYSGYFNSILGETDRLTP